jgi:hypothetical protein
LEQGRPAARTHDYTRNGTTTLFAALDIATGKLSPATWGTSTRTEEFQ